MLLEAYRRSPELYAHDILRVVWWDKQIEIARALVQYKRVLVKACHSIGKSHLGGGLINWFYDCFAPSITLSTAPTHQQVVDVLWKEVRVQRRGRAGLQPKAPRLESSPDHYAVGYTALSADAFQGRHEHALLLIFDECTGIHQQFWEAGQGMMTAERCYWLAICNPTDTTTRAYEEEIKGTFHTITVSALDHPNIRAELLGEPAPFPAAVRLEWVEGRIKEWCDPISASDRRVGDVEFPPASGKWHRPGPLFEARVLGRWPTAGTYSVWSESLWEAALVEQAIPELPLQIGCDVARFGDDNTEIVARRGPCVLWHEWHNGWDTAQTAGRLKQLAGELAEEGEDPKKVDICIDDDGVGGGVVDQRGDFAFIGVNAGSSPIETENYPNVRSELWFATAERAKEKRVDLSRLSAESRRQLRLQAMAPTWKVDAQGRRVVEKKEDTKKRLGRSPDGMDALNLAFCVPPKVTTGEWLW